MSRAVWVLNTTSLNRCVMVTCGFPFEKGQVTSTDQVITETGGRGFVTFNNPTVTQRVQWTPYGANYSDGSYRYGKITFRADMDASSERKCIITVNDTPVLDLNYSLANYAKFSGLTFEFRLNGQLATFTAANFVLQGTAGQKDQIRRYKYFARPFASMPWIWVEMVVDIPTEGVFDGAGNQIFGIGISECNFWFRYGNSYIRRGMGRTPTEYAASSRNFFLTDFVTLDILGADSCMRFEQTVYAKTVVSGVSQRYTLSNPFFNGAANRASHFRDGSARCFRGVIFLTGMNVGSNQAADRQMEISAIAEGWGPFMPPAFTDTPLPPNMLDQSNSGARAQWKSKIDTMLSRDGLGRIRALPFPASPYGLKPDAPGTGDQGTYGSGFHNNPLYYTMKASYAKELPYIVNGALGHSHRPLGMSDEDGTIYKFENYPQSTIWQTRIFTRVENGQTSSSFPDLAGLEFLGPTADNVKASDPYEDWNTIDRQHCSIYLDITAAIITADYFLLECFAPTLAELYAAAFDTHTVSTSVNGWDADRAAGRGMKSLASLYIATGIYRALVALSKRYWLGYVLKSGWERDGAGGIEKLKFIDVISSTVYPVISYRGQVDRISPPSSVQSGSLVQLYYPETPHITPWQQSFCAAGYFFVAKLLKEYFPNGKWMDRFGNQFDTNPGVNDPMFLSENIALSIARDLAGTIIMYCTHKFGAGSPTGWDYIGVGVTSRPGLSAITGERANECWPKGATVRGAVTGTTAEINFIEAGKNTDANNPLQARTIKLWLKNLTGPGFQNNGFAITERLECSNGYTSDAYASVYSPGFINSGWHGTTAYCIDRGGTANGQISGSNYRIPLTKAQMEEVDLRGLVNWDNFTNYAPIWFKSFRDYGIWQTVCAAIVLDGCQAGYYTSNSPEYTVSALQAKAVQYITDYKSIAQAETVIWDQKLWPYAAITAGFLGDGTIATSPSTIVSVAAVPAPQVSATVVEQQIINADFVQSDAVIPSTTVIATQPIDVLTRPPTLSNIFDSVQDPSILIGVSPSISDVALGLAESPEVSVITTTVPNTPIVNVIIQMSMSGPGSSPRDPVIIEPEPTIPDNPVSPAANPVEGMDFPSEVEEPTPDVDI